MAELRHAAGAFAEDAGFSGMSLADVRACVSEAVTNSVVHAFRDGRAPGTVTLSVELSADELVCIVNDDGTGFRPRVDSPGIGLGLPTIAAATASMSLTLADSWRDAAVHGVHARAGDHDRGRSDHLTPS